MDVKYVAQVVAIFSQLSMRVSDYSQGTTKWLFFIHWTQGLERSRKMATEKLHNITYYHLTDYPFIPLSKLRWSVLS